MVAKNIIISNVMSRAVTVETARGRGGVACIQSDGQVAPASAINLEKSGASVGASDAERRTARHEVVRHAISSEIVLCMRGIGGETDGLGF